MKEFTVLLQNNCVRVFFAIAGLLMCVNAASADPMLTSWLTNYSGQYARVYTTTTKRSNGNSSTTWTNQASPAYADIAQVMYSANWVYVRYPDLASYVMGPWLTPQGGVFQFWPVNQKNIAKIPRHPAVQSGKKTITGTGYSGNYVNGVAIFNALDGKAWDGSAMVSGPHNRSTYYWHRNAPVGEDFNFDYALGHQNPSGVYHTHQNPIALRYELGDHITYNTSTKNYSESTDTATNHSPIVGFSYDGYPIYGPYGYSVATDSSSGIRRMVSGYVKRDGSSGTDNVITNLSVIPAWYARFRQSQFNLSYSTTASTARPSDTGTYPVGTFAEDWSYLGDLTNPNTGSPYVQGTDFDLDTYNGRYCVTPEYPSGTYAYFIDIDSSGSATYPYVFGFEYYGTATGTNDATIAESVTTNFVGGADTPLTIQSATVNATNYNVTLVWSSVEGGTYQVENSSNQTTWVTPVSSMSSQGVSTTTNYTNISTAGTSYARVTRTALATYDDAGGSSGVVGQTNTISYLLGNDAPTVANPIPNQTNTYGTSVSYTFPANTFSDIDSGQTLTYTASSSLFTNAPISFSSSTRTFSATAISATNGGTITGSYTVQVVATDNGSPAMSATNSFTWVINKAAATITPTSFSRTYGATNQTLTGTVTGFVAADGITVDYATFATTNSPVGSYSIGAVLGIPRNRLGNYNVTTNSAYVTVTQAPLTLKASDASRAYGDGNPTFNYTFSGFVNNETTATAVTGTPSLSTSATTNSPVGTYPITALIGSVAATNYSITVSNGTLTVTQANLSASATDASRVYGETNPVFSGSITGLLNNDNITATFTSAATTNSSTGSYSIVPTFSDPSGRLPNYIVATNAGTLTITPASLLFSAQPASRAYGVTNPVFTASYSGFVNGETAASGTISGTPAFACFADTNSPVGDYTIYVGPGTLSSQDYSLTATNASMTVTQTVLTITPANVSRAYGQPNPTFTGTISGLVNNDNITANYSTTATTTSAVGTYPITATLNDPNSMLPNYNVITNQGTLTISNTLISSNYTASATQSNSLVLQAAAGTTNYTFTDTNSGLSIVVAVTMSAYSASNAEPTFTMLDGFGPDGRAARLGVESGLGGGDGNWADWYEGADFSASLVSASSGIDTNSIQFGISAIGVRPNSGLSSTWTSSACTNVIHYNGEALYPADTNTSALSGQTYTAQFRLDLSSELQFSDAVNADFNGLGLQASFFIGTQTVQGSAATLGTLAHSATQVQFTVSGTTGANYIIQSSTDLTNWTSVVTNTAPFTFTESASSTQRFYRALAQ